MTSGDVTVMVDPYFSRPTIADDAPMIPDERAVRARVPPRASLVMVAHSHADHLLDAPTVARLTGPRSWAPRARRASGLPNDKIANHFDRWTEPIGPTANLSPETTADLARFGEEVRTCAPETRVIVPAHFEAHRFD
jgi:L-ascorbate metabolism protein UlaG (beta-lactamase superfamily)